jgi:hypothetical protein
MSAMNSKSVGGVVADAMTKKPKTKTVNLGAKGSFTEHPGALHRALGIPQGEKIPAKDLQGHHSGRLGRMIASAKGFKAMSHSK